MKLGLVMPAVALFAFAQGRTTQDGVYAEAQAKRGAAIYSTSCASCHGADLSGDGQAPALADKDFNGEWKDQPLGDLFERIRMTMPADAPGTLKPADAADVLAFVLSRNRFAPGPDDLLADAAALKAITWTIAP